MTKKNRKTENGKWKIGGRFPRAALFSFLFSLFVALAGCGGARPVANGFSSVALTSANVQARMQSLRDDYQAAIRFWTKQDNSCNAPSQWFPAADCTLTSVQLATMRTGIEVSALNALNAAERARIAWEQSQNSATAAQLDTAIKKARKEVDALGIPKKG